jgi:hypothetical protein
MLGVVSPHGSNVHPFFRLGYIVDEPSYTAASVPAAPFSLSSLELKSGTEADIDHHDPAAQQSNRRLPSSHSMRATRSRAP